MARSEIQTQHEQMLYPVVRVRTEQAGGSGTAIYSARDASGEVRTYVLTNHHVVDDAIKVVTEFEPRVGKDIKRPVLKTVSAERFQYNNLSHCVGSFGIQADIVAYNKRMDLALLQLRDTENALPYVAALIPEEAVEECHVFDECYAVGAALGHPPLMTHGRINHMDDEIDDEVYWLSDAQIIYGNSGGAVFRPRDGRYELIGVPSRIAVNMHGFSADAITHLGYFAPPERIYRLLRQWDYEFIFDESRTPEECDAERERKANEARKILEWQEGPLVGGPPERDEREGEE
jgi:S1-C subfamily serine protease